MTPEEVVSHPPKALTQEQRELRPGVLDKYLYANADRLFFGHLEGAKGR